MGHVATTPQRTVHRPDVSAANQELDRASVSPQLTMDCPAEAVFGMAHRPMGDGSRYTELRPGPASCGADGRPAPGLLFLLADAVIGGACVRILDETEVVVTTCLDIEVHSAGFEATGAVSGQGRNALRYHGGAAGAAQLTSGDEVVASVSGRFAILDVGSRGGSGVDIPARPPDVDSTHRWTPSGPGALKSIDETLGTRVITADDTQTQVSFVAAPGLANDRAGLHGGCGAMMGERACDTLIRSVVPADADFRAVSMRATFFRPIAADGSTILCTARIVHRGRRLVAAQATVSTASGRPAVLVDVIFGGQPRDHAQATSTSPSPPTISC